MFWTAGSVIKNFRVSLTKLPAEPVSSNPGRWIQIGWIGLDQEIAGGGAPAGTRTRWRFRGGAIAGDGYLTIQSTSLQNKNTG
jgi:hypothetical protein